MEKFTYTSRLFRRVVAVHGPDDKMTLLDLSGRQAAVRPALNFYSENHIRETNNQEHWRKEPFWD